MKPTIHPTWFNDAKVTCACGNVFTTGSTLEEIKVDICSACHPFFTGEMRFVDRQGRVDRFVQKMKTAEARQTALKTKGQKGKAPAGPAQSYQEILKTQQTRLKAVKKASTV